MEHSENSKNNQVEKILKFIEKYDLSSYDIMKFSSLEHNKPNWLDTEKIKIYREEIDALKKKYNFGFFKWAGLQTAIQLYYPIDISNITNFFPNYEFSDEEKIELENKKNASTKGIEIKNSYSPLINSAPTQKGRDALRSLELHLKKMSGVNLTEEEIAEREYLNNKRVEEESALVKAKKEKDNKKIAKGEMWLGMTRGQLVLMKGEPGKKTESISRNKNQEEYYYDGTKSNRGNMSYKLKVVLINGEVEKWTTN